MEVYLLRHGAAVARGTPGYPNDDRPLTEEGIAKMIEGAKGIKEIIGSIEVIISSPLIRGLDTAKIAAEALGYNKKIVTTEYLIPGYPQRSLFSFLSVYNEVISMMLVGHEPHLGYLASSLLGIDESVIEFKKGGICRIDIKEFPPKEKGKLIWHLTPKQLITLGQINTKY
jgi:phosphohistidine phosphatase